jgi:hypothetical protein
MEQTNWISNSTKWMTFGIIHDKPKATTATISIHNEATTVTASDKEMLPNTPDEDGTITGVGKASESTGEECKNAGCTVGQKQCRYKSKDEISSPMVSSEALFLTSTVNAQE